MSIDREEAGRRHSPGVVVGSVNGMTRAAQAPTVGFQPRNDMAEIDDARNVLMEAIQETLRWRREKVVDFPNDRRNVTATILLEAMLKTVDAVPDSLIRQYVEAWDQEISARTSEAQSLLLRDVGFRSTIAHAVKLIEHLLDHAADFRADLRLG